MMLPLLTVMLSGISDGQTIPDRYAFCVPDGKGQYRQDGENIRPEITWSAGPEGTKSYAIIVVDPDVPAIFDNANKEGVMLPADMPRQNFYHWVLADVPAGTTTLAEAAPGTNDIGVSGLNNYGAGGSALGVGYDGPCPPWNDERMHHYHFQVYALDVPSLELKAGFSGPDAEKAMEGHILAKGEVTGLYTTNQSMR